MSCKPMQLGHVNIYVRNARRAERFYTEVLGLTVTGRRPDVSFLAANEGLSHEIALAEIGEEAPGPDRGRVGLNHLAWQMHTFEDLKEVYHRLKERDIQIDRISDHNNSLGVYFFDPDGNRNEVYYELPRDQWPQGKGEDIFTGEEPFPWSLEDEVKADSPQRSVSLV